MSMTQRTGDTPACKSGRLKSQPTPAGDRLRQEFGRNLREARVAAGLSQRRIEELTGIDQALVSAIEKGAWNLTIEAMARLAHAVNVPVCELLKPA
jgi:ribosome-binding protein aMBF1 (putative translation factor)